MVDASENKLARTPAPKSALRIDSTDSTAALHVIAVCVRPPCDEPPPKATMPQRLTAASVAPHEECSPETPVPQLHHRLPLCRTAQGQRPGYAKREPDGTLKACGRQPLRRLQLIPICVPPRLSAADSSPRRPPRVRPPHRKSNRSRFITLAHAAAKSRTNAGCESAHA